MVPDAGEPGAGRNVRKGLGCWSRRFIIGRPGPSGRCAAGRYPCLSGCRDCGGRALADEPDSRRRIRQVSKWPCRLWRVRAIETSARRGGPTKHTGSLVTLTSPGVSGDWQLSSNALLDE